MRQFVGKLVRVVLLACMVWIFADQITTQTITKSLRLKIDAAAGADLIPTLTEPNAGGSYLDLKVQLSGPRGQLERLQEELSNMNHELVYRVQTDGGDVETLIENTGTLIEKLLPAQFSAVSVTVDQPRQIRIALDRLITEPMPVKVDTGTIETTEPVFSPREVNVRIARSVFRQLPQDNRVVIVDIEDKLRGRSDDEIVDEQFSLPQQVAGRSVTTDPSYVTVKLQIKRRYDRRELEYSHSQVQVRAPVDLMTKYSVDIKDQNIKVVLYGPAEIMSDEENLKRQVVPFISVRYDEAPDELSDWFPRDVEFDLPEGVSVDSNAPARPSVLFKLEARPAAVEVPK